MTYPDPEQVAADIPDKKTRAAAFSVLLRTVNNNGLSEAAADKYRKALDDLDPPWVPEHPKFTKELHDLADKPAFRYAIVKKYLPEMAAKVGGQLREQDLADRNEAFTEKARDAVSLLLLITFAVPFLFLIWCSSSKRRGPLIPDNVAGPLRLPDHLRRLKVFRRRYTLLFDCGQIYDKTKEQESYTTTTTTPGRQYTIGDTTYVEAGTTQTHYHVINYDRYAFTTPDGRSSWARYRELSFHAVKGHIISVMSYDTVPLIAYNHTTNNFLPLSDGISDAHRFPGRWAWGVTVAAIVATMFALKGYMGADYQELPHVYNWETSILVAAVIFGGISAVYILIFKLIIQFIRNCEFRWRHQPKLRKFLEDCTPTLMQHFPPLPNTPDVRPA